VESLLGEAQEDQPEDGIGELGRLEASISPELVSGSPKAIFKILQVDGMVAVLLVLLRPRSPRVSFSPDYAAS